MIEISQQNTHIIIEESTNNKRLVKVKPLKENTFIPISRFETKYPISLIEKILEIKNGEYLCDELAREEDLGYVQKDLEMDLRAYFDFDKMNGKRILDFGCGSGASSMILARFFPKSEIVGVELEEKLLSIAKARLDFYKYPNVTFHNSPSGSELPANIGEFDLVIMSAVYEHLLPNERKSVMPMVWKNIKKNGHLFLNMTPHRYFPIEHHTTNLPLINYLPDSLALSASRKFSNRIDNSEPWEMLLRRGIRGATENEILKILNKTAKARLTEPHHGNINDRIDLWYSQLSKERMALVKKIIKGTLKVLKSTTGVVLVPNLSLAFQKQHNSFIRIPDSI